MTLDDSLWGLLDRLHLSDFFENYNIPPILFPVAIILLVALIIVAMSGGGALATKCGDDICSPPENETSCSADCRTTPEVKGTTVWVKLDKDPSCSLTLKLYDSEGTFLRKLEGQKTSFDFTGIDSPSVYVNVSSKYGKSQSTPQQAVSGEETVIRVVTSSDICQAVAQTTGVIRLVVKDAVSLSMLNGVSVTIAETQNGQRLNTRVPEQMINGQYDFTLPAPKQYTIYAQKEGYIGYDGTGDEVTLAAGQSYAKTITLSSTAQQAGDLEVCVKNSTRSMVEGLIAVQEVSGNFMITGELSEADLANEPTFSGCYVFIGIPAGKIVSASMPSPPAGCVPAAAEPATVTIESAGRQIMNINVECQPSDIGYLKVKVIGRDGTTLTVNGTITIWTEDATLIPGTGMANSLSIGSAGYTEEVSVPAGESVYAWVRGLPLGYLDYKSPVITVAKGQHRSVEVYLNYSEQQAGEPSEDFTFSGVAAPSAVQVNATFSATVSEILYRGTELGPPEVYVSAAIGDRVCNVSHDTIWRFGCLAPNEPDEYDLVITATYNGTSGDYSLPVDVREYGSDTGLLTITPIFKTHGDPPFDLYYEILYNGTPMTQITDQEMTVVFADSPSAFPGNISNLAKYDEYWTLTADIPYKGDYQMEMFIEVLVEGVYYNTTYTVGFSADSHSEKLEADVVISDRVLTPSERFTVEVILSFGNKVAYGLEILEIYTNRIYYTLSWDEGRKLYSLPVTAPAAEVCNMDVKFLINDEEITDKETLHVINTLGAASASCPLDRGSTCGSREDTRACVYNSKAGIAPYTEALLTTCIASGCPFTAAVQCNGTNKGDLEPDCQLDDADSEKANQWLTSIESQTERNELEQCLDIDNDEDVDDDDLTCLQNMVATKWYGDTAGENLNGLCTDGSMKGGFCFGIDTEAEIPGDLVLDGNIREDDIEVMQKIIDAVAASVTPHEDILAVADFNQDGNINSTDIDCQEAFMTVDFETGAVLTSSSQSMAIATECMNIFDLDCKGSKGDLNGDGMITEVDFIIVQLIVNDRLENMSSVKDCADVNSDELVDDTDVECLEYYLSGDQEHWMACLDCEENLPEGAYSEIEICNDGWDNNCDKLIDSEDSACECGQETPCDMKYDADAGTSPGVDDENYKLCRDVDWDMEDWKWFSPSEIECNTDNQCGATRCESEDWLYKCSSEDGTNGKWFDIPTYCCFKVSAEWVESNGTWTWGAFNSNFDWTHDTAVPQEANDIWTVCVVTDEETCPQLLSSFDSNTPVTTTLQNYGFDCDNANINLPGDCVFPPQSTCAVRRSYASDNYYLPVEDSGKYSGRHCGDEWDNDCRGGDCTCSP